MKHLLNQNQLNKIKELEKHWNKKEVQKNARLVIAKLNVENLSLKSSWGKIFDCLNKVVCPDFCISIAYILKYQRKILRRI